MISQVLNDFYHVCCNVGSTVVDVTQSTLHKIADLLKRLFLSIGYFASGFCLGAAAVSCWAVFSHEHQHPLYVLDTNKLGFFVIAGGLVGGVVMASEAFKQN